MIKQKCEEPHAAGAIMGHSNTGNTENLTVRVCANTVCTCNNTDTKYCIYLVLQFISILILERYYFVNRIIAR